MILNTRNIDLAKWQLYSYCAVAASIPLPIIVNNIAIICALCVSIMGLTINRGNRIISKPSHDIIGFLLFSMVYLTYVIGLFYSTNVERGVSELETRLSLLLFPILFFFSPSLSQPDLKKISYTFVISTLATSITSLVYASYRFFVLKDIKKVSKNWNPELYAEYAESIRNNLFWEYFSYTELASTVNLHPTYFSLFCLFSVFIVLFSDQKIYVKVLITLFLVVFIILLGSRASIFTAVICVSLIIFKQLRSKLDLNKSLAGAFLFCALFVLVAYQIPQIRTRTIDQVRKSLTRPNRKKLSALDLRKLEWICGFEVWKEAPIIGVGTGSLRSSLIECYKTKNFGQHQKYYNLHNLFLQVSAKLGVFGFLILASSIVYPLIQAIRKENRIYYLFLISFILISLTESTFSRQKGVVFYSFFNSLQYSRLFMLNRRYNV